MTKRHRHGITVSKEVYCRIINTLTRSDKEVLIELSRDLTSNTFTLSGTMPADQGPWLTKGALHHPGEYARRIFAEELEKHGVVIAQEEIVGLDRNRYTLASHSSAPLAFLLKKLNKMSNNLTGELLLRAIPEGAKSRQDLLEDMQIAPSSYRLHDGAGLSRLNLVSPKQVVMLLEHALHAPYAELFIDSLPIGGVDGTLANRLKDLPGNTFVKAKTGSMGGGQSSCGHPAYCRW